MVLSTRVNGYDAWSIYMAIKLHFSEGSYDAFKFNFKGPRLKESTFAGRRDRYFFEKLAKKYQKREDVIRYFLSNTLAGNTWIGTMTDEVLTQWTGKMQALSYMFKSELAYLRDVCKGEFDELFKVQGGQCALYEAHHRGEASLETLTILDVLCNYTKNISKNNSDPLGTLQGVTAQIRQYKPFIVQHMGDVTSFRETVIKTFTSS